MITREEAEHLISEGVRHALIKSINAISDSIREYIAAEMETLRDRLLKELAQRLQDLEGQRSHQFSAFALELRNQVRSELQTVRQQPTYRHTAPSNSPPLQPCRPEIREEAQHSPYEPYVSPLSIRPPQPPRSLSRQRKQIFPKRGEQDREKQLLDEIGRMARTAQPRQASWGT